MKKKFFKFQMIIKAQQCSLELLNNNKGKNRPRT